MSKRDQLTEEVITALLVILDLRTAKDAAGKIINALDAYLDEREREIFDALRPGELIKRK